VNGAEPAAIMRKYARAICETSLVLGVSFHMTGGRPALKNPHKTEL
jgi:hypothetical protein